MTILKGNSTKGNKDIATSDVIGNLTSLTTSNKSSLVNAVNEVKSGVNSVTSTANANLSKINTVTSTANTNKSSIGTLSTLKTTKKDNLVNAINEVKDSSGGEPTYLVLKDTVPESIDVKGVSAIHFESSYATISFFANAYQGQTIVVTSLRNGSVLFKRNTANIGDSFILNSTLTLGNSEAYLMVKSKLGWGIQKITRL